MNSNEIFTIALNLSRPWFVETATFNASDSSLIKELHLYINFERGGEFELEDGTLCKAYDTEDRVWQHLDFFQHKCYLHARVPRVEESNGSIKRVSVPWARANSGFTLMFEAYAMLLIESEMPVNKASKCMRVIPNRIWRVFNYWVNKAVDKDNLSAVCEVGIDETSRKKGHDYITIFVDMPGRRVIDVEIGKDKEAIENFVHVLESKGGDRKQIEQVSIDMSPSFIAGSMEQFSNAQLTFDKFHIVYHLNQAMDDVRKLERRENELLKGHKYTFLKDKNKLTRRKQGELDYLLMNYPKLGDAYRLKQMFLDVYDITNPDEAKGYLAFWCEMAKESKIPPFIKFANLIKAHWFGIINYFDSRLTNAVLESINAKIQLAKKRARGYRNTQNFCNMIYFLCGKLKLDYPHYPL